MDSKKTPVIHMFRGCVEKVVIDGKEVSYKVKDEEGTKEGGK